MSKQEIIDAIQNYASNAYNPPLKFYSIDRSVFYQKSVSNWAVKELIDYILECPDPPILAIMDFKDQMETFSCYGKKHRDSTRVFSIASDVSKDILDFVITLTSWGCV